MAEKLKGIPQYELMEEELSKLSIAKFKDGLRLDENLPEPAKISLDVGSSVVEWAQNLGMIDLLPLEIQQPVLSSLDMNSVANFRMVNREADLLFRAIPEYRWIAKHFPKALFAIQRIGTGKWTTYIELYEELHRSDCENCGDFSCFLYLLTCRRVCFICFTSDQKYLPLRIYRAHQKFGISEAVLLGQPHMHAMPGAYSYYENECRRRRLLVDRQSAYSKALEIHGSVAVMEGVAAQMQALKEQIYASDETKSSTRRSRRPPKNRDMIDIGIGNPYRYMAIISVPWVNKDEQRTEWGMHCKGCRSYSQNPGLHFQRKYSVKGFRDHIHQYGEIYRVDCDHSERWQHRGQPSPY